MIIVWSLVAHVISVPLSAQLMQISPWIPLLGGLALVIVGCSCIAFIPETLRVTKDLSVPAEFEREIDVNNSSLLHSLKQHTLRGISELKASTAMLRSYTTVALLFTFAVQGFTDRASGFTVQYLSKRFHWSLSRSGMLFSVGNIINILLHLVILPGCSQILASPRFIFRYSPATKDLVLARASALLLVLGSLLLAWPRLPAVVCGLVVFTLGSGFQSLCRALITTLVDSEHTARLYTLISVIQACSSLSSGPIVAWLFGRGLHMGGYWVGLPYFGVTLLCCFGTVAVFVARMPVPD